MADSEGMIRQHDKYQFELKLGYDLNARQRRQKYVVETFFFLPENLDVNESTYSKNQFYRDLLLYIRFRTPDFTLADLLVSPRSPLQRVPEKRAAFGALPSEKNASVLHYELRLLGCVVRNTLRVQARAVQNVLRDGQAGQAAPILSEFLSGVNRLTLVYRSWQKDFKPGTATGDLAGTYAFADEYLSLLVEGRAHELIRAIDGAKAAVPLASQRQALLTLAQSEVDYRRGAGYPSIVEEDKDNETFVFRQSVLKKFIASALHLSVRTEEEGKGLEQMALAAGAGVAMFCGATIAIYYQKIYGGLSLGFVAILVVSYMLRDRLKAVTQAWLRGWLEKRLFDQATDIYDPSNREKIGLCRESVAFVKERRVDPRVRALRDRDHITEIENTYRAEKVIHYVKEITLYGRRFLRNRSRKAGVTDIVRFNLRTFLLKMDEPLTDLYLLKEGKSALVKGTRVYHVNVILKYSSGYTVRYERMRLVLNRDGIKRIEPVGSDLTLEENN